jgi:SAM-dependent methyltransferase
MNVFEHNQRAWNHEARQSGRWSTPVSDEAIAAARRGEWKLYLTPTTPVPASWLAYTRGADILCLASAGGQQAPVLAAAGGKVTVFDCSDEQLKLDRKIADDHRLALRTVVGDMRDLSVFPDGSFDLVINACSTCFVPDVRPVWAEAHRVLKPGGSLLTGFLNPLYYLFDRDLDDKGELKVCHALPYSDLSSISAQRRFQKVEQNAALEFGHTLTDQIGGQISAGFAITGFFEDRWSDTATTLNRYTTVYVITRATRA